MPTPVLIDCDPGIDDTLALIYLAGLAHAGEIEIVGVTTTAGNVDVETTERNAAFVLQACAISPGLLVAAGEPTPLNAELVTTPETHGQFGLGYAKAPEFSAQVSWQDLWLAAINNYGEDLRLIVTGPATNVATFSRQYPAEFARIKNLSVMGGAVNYRGNTTPTAEWNFWVDPHAAKEMFASTSLSVTLCSLEVTEQMLLSPQRLEEIIEQLQGVAIASFLDDIVRFYFEFHESNSEGYQAQIHDLFTCMIALEKIPFQSVHTTIDVEADSPLMRGTSVADLRNHWNKDKNAILVTAADIDSAWAEFHRAIRQLAQTATS